MTKITWKSMKNTEREAIRKHGDVWNCLRHAEFRGSMCFLIGSPDGSDQRWIQPSQVVTEI